MSPLKNPLIGALLNTGSITESINGIPYVFVCVVSAKYGYFTYCLFDCGNPADRDWETQEK